MNKGKTKVWVACEAGCAQAYHILDKHGKLLRREQSHSEARRIVALFAKPKPPRDRSSMIGKRWADVQDKL
jgi:hypothetical protein